MRQECYVALGPWAIFVPMIALTLALSGLSMAMEAISEIWKWTLPATGLALTLLAVIW